MSNCYNHPNVYVGMIPKSNNLQNNQFHQSIVYKAKLCTGREIGYWLGEEGYCDEFLNGMESRIFQFVDGGNDLSDGGYMESNVEIDWHIRIVETNVKEIQEIIYEVNSSDDGVLYLSFDGIVNDKIMVQLRDKLNKALANNQSSDHLWFYSDEIDDSIPIFETKFYECFANPMYRCDLSFAFNVRLIDATVNIEVVWKPLDDDALNKSGWHIDSENIKLAVEENIDHVFIEVPEQQSYTFRLAKQLFRHVLIHMNNPMEMLKDVQCNCVHQGRYHHDVYKLSWDTKADSHDNRIYKLFSRLGHIFDYIEDVMEGREENPQDNKMRINYVDFQLTIGDIFDMVRFMEERFPESYCKTYNYRPYVIFPKRGWDMEIINYAYNGASIQFMVI